MRGYERLRSYQERVRVPRSARSHRRGWRKPKNSNRNARRSLRRNVDDDRFENLDLQDAVNNEPPQDEPVKVLEYN